MDLNLTVLAGKLAAEPELKFFESGSQLVRLLVTVRSSEPRRRIDVIPVVLWDPDDELVEVIQTGGLRGAAIWVTGSVQRRFWATGGDSRTSRVEVTASDVKITRTADQSDYR